MTKLAFLGTLSLFFMQTIFAQTYQKPNADMTAIVDAAPTPSVSLSPNYTTMLLAQSAGSPSIAELAEPELRLAGLRLSPVTNGSSRSGGAVSLTLKNMSDLKERKVTGIPANTRIGFPMWSNDGSRFAFTLTFADRIELWGADVASGVAKRLTDRKINETLGGCSWSGNSQLICTTIATTRGAAPKTPLAPAGPAIQENLGRSAPARTFQDLLKNAHDEALFEYYTTSQLVAVNWSGATTTTQNIGRPAVIGNVSSSPDGNFLLVSTIQRPYSYLVTAGSFPQKTEVWDKRGNVVKLVADLPLRDNVPIGFNAVPSGIRSVSWRADVAATLVWAEALDGGDPKKNVPFRDEIFTLSAPFTGQASSLLKTQQRFSGIIWGNANMALVSDGWQQTRNRRTFMFNPSSPSAEAKKILDLNTEDRYNNPGSPLMERNSYGRMVIRTTEGGNAFFMSGQGASTDGDRPFLRKWNWQTNQTQELWRSQAPHFETLTALLPDGKTAITRRESVEEPPNYYKRDLSANTMSALTAFPHPYPQLKGISKEIINYKRADGVDLNAVLYLPKGYKKEDGALPTFIWAYPAEFKDAAAAGQMSGSPYTFTRLSPQSALMMVLAGYAVLDNASVPIVGMGKEEPNDTFIEQLVASMKAAIDEGVKRGVVDPNRVGVGGHSYGAFMTANLLAHSRLFKAGIARSGAYNRTLTPFGFQNEERTIWQAPHVYSKMSPFMHADKVKDAILFIHGEADNNAGTFPIQSERMYNAVKGHGGTTRLVFLPHESHGYAARESLLHMLWETTTWLDTYVKNAPKTSSK